jgi:hypothetical protein
MTELIKTVGELVSYLTTRKLCSKTPPESVMVSGKIRKEVLTSENQGWFSHNGTIGVIEFESLGGGVYKAFIKKDKPKRGRV